MSDIPVGGFTVPMQPEAGSAVPIESTSSMERPAPAAAIQAPPPPQKRRGGRKPGSKNKPKAAWRPDVHEPVHQEMRPDPIRTRQRHVGGKFEIPPELLARYLPGRSVEWKRHTTLGQTDPIYEMDLKSAGWWPVQAHQLPGLMPEGYRGPIIRESMMLYERPQELTNQARLEDYHNAAEVIRTTERRLGIAGPNEMPREHPKIQPRVNQEYYPLMPREIPK